MKYIIILDDQVVDKNDDGTPYITGVYHEETNVTPRDITFINIGEDAKKDKIILTLASKLRGEKA